MAADRRHLRVVFSQEPEPIDTSRWRRRGSIHALFREDPTPVGELEFDDDPDDAA